MAQRNLILSRTFFVQKPKEPKSHKGSQGLMIAAGCCALVSALAFWSASLQPKSPSQLLTQSNACSAELPRIAKYPSSIRGTTKVAKWYFFDQRASLGAANLINIDAPDIPDGTAQSITIEAAERHAYDIGVSMKNQRKIESGETVTAEVWLRARPLAGQTLPIKIEAKLQQEEENGFRFLNTTQFSLTNQFAKYALTVPLSQAYCLGDLNFALHLATGSQIIDIGPGTLKVVQPNL